MTIDLDTARSYLKADGDDDDIIAIQITQAQSICEGYCNRRFYDSDADQAADFAQALTDRSAQLAARTTQLATITGTDSDSMDTQSLITGHYVEVLGRIAQRMNGVVIDGTITAAMLMTLGHLYVNREDNIVTGNNAVSLPAGAQRILQPYLWIGPLAGGSTGTSGYAWSEGS